jgi:acid phosphatase
MKPTRIPTFALLALLIACAAHATQLAPAVTPTTPATASAEQAVAADTTPAKSNALAPNDNLNAVAWFQTSAEARLVYEETYRAATDRLSAALRDRKWDALPKEERTNAYAKLKPAVILDVDETVLDNSPYQARLIRDGRDYDEASWADWVHERAARALPGALVFANAAAKKGIRVIYLSNRSQDLNADTLANLRALGFPVADDSVFLGLGTYVKDCEQNGSEKTCRRQLIGRDYRVLMQFGDQLGDFVQLLANTPDGRAATIKPYAGWIGERWFVLPNPTYGSWEPALFNNDWTQPAGERRRQKIQALRVK